MDANQTTARVCTQQGTIDEIATVDAVEVDEGVRKARALVSRLIPARKRWMISFTSVRLEEQT